MSTVARSWVEDVLGRPELEIPATLPLRLLRRERILITGANGSLGRELRAWLDEEQISNLATDIDADADATTYVYDVRVPLTGCDDYRPTLIFHLAGAKHAPEGETDPVSTFETNTVGTANVLNLARETAARVVLASTCKAADPETVYGASKLLAERMVLNAGGTVARFYNVVESAGNVFETWAAIPAESSLPVSFDCARYFITLREAVALLLWAAVLHPGRYTVDPGRARSMHAVAAALYPGRPLRWVSARRGDRIREPRCALSERVERLNHGLVQIRGAHDPA